MLLIVGLTGGIASGKSTVSKFLADLGAVIIDADQIARQIVQPGELGWQKIKDTWGENYFLTDGTLDRKKLGQEIFLDSAMRFKLNALLHPCIQAVIRQKVAFWQKESKQPKLLVIDAALLLEVGLDNLVDEIWLVFCSINVQVKRLMKRNSFSEEEARIRTEVQMPLSEKKNKADVLLNNDGDLTELLSRVKQLWAER